MVQMVSLKNPKDVMVIFLLSRKKRKKREGKILVLLFKNCQLKKNEGDDNICLPIESVRINRELLF